MRLAPTVWQRPPTATDSDRRELGGRGGGALMVKRGGGGGWGPGRTGSRTGRGGRKTEVRGKDAVRCRVVTGEWWAPCGGALLPFRTLSLN